MKQAIGILAIVCAATGAHASYELVLALDAANKEVLRYDGDTGVSLGSFGKTRLQSPTAMAIDKSSGKLYIHDAINQSVQVYNYSTGGMEAEFSAPFSFAMMTAVNGGGFLLGDYFTGAATRYSATGAVVATYNAPIGATGVRAMGQAPDGSVYITHSGTAVISRYSVSGGTRLNAVTGAVATVEDSRQMFFQDNSVVVSAGNDKGWNRFTYGTSSWTSATFVSSAPMNWAYGVAPGHGEQVFVGGYTATASAIYGYNRNTGGLRQTITPPASAKIVSLASVVAPEPGSFLAIGLGLAFLASRRNPRA